MFQSSKHKLHHTNSDYTSHKALKLGEQNSQQKAGNIKPSEKKQNTPNKKQTSQHCKEWKKYYFLQVTFIYRRTPEKPCEAPRESRLSGFLNQWVWGELQLQTESRGGDHPPTSLLCCQQLSMKSDNIDTLFCSNLFHLRLLFYIKSVTNLYMSS